MMQTIKGTIHCKYNSKFIEFVKMMKLYGKLFVFILLLMWSSGVSAQKGSRITTVVIDAGHGGKDPGALGKHSREKDVALAVALKTGHYIEKYLPDVKVIYTRKDDRFVELYKRAEIANKNNADFFISIHCNSNPSPLSSMITVHPSFSAILLTLSLATSLDRKSTRLNSSHTDISRMPSSA